MWHIHRGAMNELSDYLKALATGIGFGVIAYVLMTHRGGLRQRWVVAIAAGIVATGGVWGLCVLLE